MFGPDAGPDAGTDMGWTCMVGAGHLVSGLRVDLNLCTVFPGKPDFIFIFRFHKIIVPVSRNIWANSGKWSWKVRCGSGMFGTWPFGEADRDQV